eukprot:265213_1
MHYMHITKIRSMCRTEQKDMQVAVNNGNKLIVFTCNGHRHVLENVNHNPMPKHFLQKREQKKKTINSISSLSNHQIVELWRDKTGILELLQFGLWKEYLYLHQQLVTLQNGVHGLWKMIGWTDACYALEKYDYVRSKSFAIDPLSIECMDAKKTKYYSQWIFITFLSYYSDYLKSIHIHSVNMRVVWMSHLGYFMLFCTDIILNELKKYSQSELIKMLSAFNESDIYTSMKSRAQIKFLLGWNTRQMQKYGVKLLEEWKLKNNPHNAEDASMRFVTAMQPSLKNNNHDLSIQYLILSSIATSNNLLHTVVVLRILSKHCYMKNEYLISMKILRCCYRMCGKYMCPSFVEDKYWKRRKQIKRKIKTLMCAQCNRSEKRLRVCKGCMIANYCSVLCQKLHWNKIHRNKCSRYWQSEKSPFYSLLKCYFFDKL